MKDSPRFPGKRIPIAIASGLAVCAAAGILLARIVSYPSSDLGTARWLVLGAFPLETEQSAGDASRYRDFLSSAGGEGEARLDEGRTIEDKPVVPVRAKNGAVDLLKLFPGATKAAAYAYLEIDSPIGKNLALKLGSDDGIRAWVNGSLVWSNQTLRSLTPDEDAVPIHLVKGRNAILLRIDQAGGDWGFSAKLRSLAEEERDWKASKSRELRVSVFPDGPDSGGRKSCVVSTFPSFAVDEPVEVTVSGSNGLALSRIEGKIGEPIAFDTPKDLEGIIRLKAAGKGRNADLASRAAICFAGNEAEIEKNLVARARLLSKALEPAEGSEDVSATLDFLADQLEGRMDASLSTPERNLRAVASIADILDSASKGAWKPASLRGIRQWAYRSSIDGSAQPYTTYLPSSYDPGRKYPLVVVLHGYSGDDWQAARVLADLRSEDFIVVGAYGRGDMGYRSMGEQDVLDVMDRVERIYRVDPDRVYLMGFSMGGLGAWRIGQFHADRFAAMATFCGWSGTDYLENLRNLPVLIVHGGADPTVPVAMDRAAVAKLRKLNYSVRYDELPGANHGAWEAWAKKNGGSRIFDWFGQFRRNPWPERVSIRTKTYLRYGSLHWAGVRELSGTSSSLEASIKNGGITVDAKGVSALSLDLRHPSLSQTGEIRIVVNGSILSVQAGNPDLVIAAQPGQQPAWAPVEETGKAPHLGGGLADLFHGPVTFVYGTQKAESREMLRKAAETFADFSPTPEFPIGSKIGRIPVVADTELGGSPSGGRNLVLIGNAEENRITAAFMREWAGKLPVSLSGDEVMVDGQGFGKSILVMAYPNPANGGRLVAVVTLPAGEGIERDLRLANLPLRGYRVDESATDPGTYPDIFVLRSLHENPVGVWSFNRDWSRLISLAQP